MRAELGGVDAREATAELADRRSGGGQDDGLGHVRRLRGSGGSSVLNRTQRLAGRVARSWRSPPPPMPLWPPARTRSRSACSPTSRSPTTSRTARSARCSSAARRGAALRHLALAHHGAQRVLLVGLGTARRSTPSGRAPRPRRSSTGPRELGTATLCWEVPHHVDDGVVAALVEGTLLRAYRFDRYQSARDGDRLPRAAGAQRPPRHRRRGARERRSSPRRRTAPATWPTRPPNDLTPDRARRVRGGARRAPTRR